MANKLAISQPLRKVASKTNLNRVSLFTVLLLLAGVAIAPLLSASHPGIGDTCATGSLQISPTDLYRSYDMETIRSSKAKDFSVNADDATANGGVTIGGYSGLFAQSTHFDGVDDYLSDTVSTPPGDFTIAFWFRPENNDVKIPISPGGNHFFEISGSGSGKMFWYDNGGITSSAAQNLNQWNSVVALHNAGTGEMRLRLNGGTDTGPVYHTPAGWATLGIGSYPPAVSTYAFQGAIDEVEIFTRLLTADEITAFEESPNGACATPPVVETDSATNILCSSAFLNGNLTSVGTSTSVQIGFLYGKSPVLAGATNHTVGTVNVTGTFSLNVMGLEANTFYYFRAWANGTDGYAQGNITFFQTIPCVGCFATFDGFLITALVSLLLLFVFLFLVGLKERTIMVMAGIAGFMFPVFLRISCINNLIVILSILPGVVCIALAITRRGK